MADNTQTPEEIRTLLRITCADAGPLLSDFHDGALPQGDRVLVQAHLDGCVACGVILDQLHATTVTLRQAGAARPPLAESVLDSIIAGLQRN